MVDRNYNAQESERNPRTSHDRHSARRSTQNNSTTSDEIIVSLANTYENKRARQVNEWERVQVNNVRRAS
ncbi:MAG: hypothetical protein DMF62_11155 [Acidobacteria bacterium]|nr:MAG: hypothetical protein DMF62_11155 [Acidobacteriota bacterium]